MFRFIPISINFVAPSLLLCVKMFLNWQTKWSVCRLVLQCEDWGEELCITEIKKGDRYCYADEPARKCAGGKLALQMISIVNIVSWSAHLPEDCFSLIQCSCDNLPRKIMFSISFIYILVKPVDTHKKHILHINYILLYY